MDTMDYFATGLAVGMGIGIVIVVIAVIGFVVWRMTKAGSRRSTGGGRRPAGGPRTGRTAASGLRSSGASSGRDKRTKLNWLLGRSGPVKGNNFHVGEQTVSIGRDIRNFIQVSNDAASNRHAVLLGDAEGMTLIDVDSSNGTILNGKQIDAKVEYRLSDGDEIKIADSVFLYRSEGRYSDDSQSAQKEISLQQKTAALSAVGADGTANPMEADADLNQQVLMGLTRHKGDYQAVADELDLDVSIVQQIIQNATGGRR